MQSKSKKAPTVAEAEWLALVARTACACCDAAPLPRHEVHEIEQGRWYLSVSLCSSCHRGPLLGLHGQRHAWKLRKLDETKALAITIGRVHQLQRAER